MLGETIKISILDVELACRRGSIIINAVLVLEGKYKYSRVCPLSAQRKSYLSHCTNAETTQTRRILNHRMNRNLYLAAGRRAAASVGHGEVQWGEVDGMNEVELV